MRKPTPRYSAFWGRYQVTNRHTRETGTVMADCSYMACEMLGWRMADCDVVPCGPYVQLPNHEKLAVLNHRWAR